MPFQTLKEVRQTSTRIAKAFWATASSASLKELAQTGEMTYFAELCADLPPYMLALMSVPGIGPRTAQRLHETLGIETPEQLFEAAQSGRLRQLWGFGPKREQQYAQLSLFDEPDDGIRWLRRGETPIAARSYAGLRPLFCHSR